MKVTNSLSTYEKIFYFILVGSVGFAIDGGMLIFLSKNFGLNLYLSRLVSFTFATMTTWVLNRLFVFKHDINQNARKRVEYARYLSVQICGGLTNLLVFTVAIKLYPLMETYLIISFALGSAFGLIVNFTGSRYWVFQKNRSDVKTTFSKNISKTGVSSMPIGFSLYLDLVRFSAAMLVFLAHISLFTKGTILWRLEPYGGIAVTIFFVLSGYVIAYVVATREKNVKQYFVNRIARLYSVVLLALLVTFIFDKVGMYFNLESYKMPLDNAGYISESWTGYLASLFFVNEFQIFGFNGIAPGSNAPFWSLSFEATYYFIAGIILFCRNKILAILAALLILVLAGKTIAILLPTWLLGYTLYHLQDKVKLSIFTGWFLFILSGLAILTIPFFSDAYLPKENPFGIWFPFNWLAYNRHFLNDYNTAIIFAVHLISARSVFVNIFQIHTKTKAVIRWLGLLTFPLYCLHFPALRLFSTISIWNNKSIENLIFISLLTFLLVVVLTPICESLKQVIRRAF